MTAITGDVTTYLELLGRAPDAPQVAAVVDDFGVEVEVEEMHLVGEQERYLILADAGIDVNFTDGELTAIFVSLRGDDDHAPYRTPASLVDGLTFDEDRDAIRAVLGTPKHHRLGYDLFEVDGRFLHVEYDEGTPHMVTALLRDVQD